MGFCLREDNMPIGQLVYRKGNKILRPPRSKKFAPSKKTYFDDDGNPYQFDQVTNFTCYNVLNYLIAWRNDVLIT